MKLFSKSLAIVAIFFQCLGASEATAAASANTCTGKMMNPITDVCWSCMFPLSIGWTPFFGLDQEDIENVGPPYCKCGVEPYVSKVGIAIGFWEPVRQVEVTRTPWCFPSLGGKKIGSGKAPTPAVGAGTKRNRSTNTSFYQAHWYINAVLYALDVMSDTSCLEPSDMLDLVYVTELDPSWNDDELSEILNPDVFLFSNPVAVAACAVDCVASTLTFPLPWMQWCGGCQGTMFPLNGHVQAHVSGPQATSLILQRYAMKLHRETIAFAGNNYPGWCGLYPMQLLDKRIYKYSMLYPATQGRGVDGRCCQPFGRSTHLWATGKEFPIRGEDFVYMLYRKRNCCEKISGYKK